MSVKAHFVLDDASTDKGVFNSKFLNLTEEYANNQPASKEKS